jgi:hypothetical protein
MRQGWRDLRLAILSIRANDLKGGGGEKGDHNLYRWAMRHYSRRLMTHVPFFYTTRYGISFISFLLESRIFLDQFLKIIVIEQSNKFSF